MKNKPMNYARALSLLEVACETGDIDILSVALKSFVLKNNIDKQLIHQFFMRSDINKDVFDLLKQNAVDICSDKSYLSTLARNGRYKAINLILDECNYGAEDLCYLLHNLSDTLSKTEVDHKTYIRVYNLANSELIVHKDQDVKDQILQLRRYLILMNNYDLLVALIQDSNDILFENNLLAQSILALSNDNKCYNYLWDMLKGAKPKHKSILGKLRFK